MNAGPLIFIVLMLGVMWLLLIRPQRRRQSAQTRLLAGLSVGDEVVTAGGLYGHIRALDEDEVTLEIAPGTNVRLAKRAVAAVVEPEDALEAGDGQDELEEPAPEERAPEEPAPEESPAAEAPSAENRR